MASKPRNMPYEFASSGIAALVEAERILRGFGCDNFGSMQDWARGCLVVQFTWKERTIRLEASWNGYAQLWLKRHPRGRNTSAEKHQAEAKKRGEIAAPSILRDWVKAQVTAVEIGLMPFDHAFMPHMIANDGRRVIEHLQSALMLESKP